MSSPSTPDPRRQDLDSEPQRPALPDLAELPPTVPVPLASQPDPQSGRLRGRLQQKEDKQPAERTPAAGEAVEVQQGRINKSMHTHIREVQHGGAFTEQLRQGRIMESQPDFHGAVQPDSIQTRALREVFNEQAEAREAEAARQAAAERAKQAEAARLAAEKKAALSKQERGERRAARKAQRAAERAQMAARVAAQRQKVAPMTRDQDKPGDQDAALAGRERRLALQAVITPQAVRARERAGERWASAVQHDAELLQAARGDALGMMPQGVHRMRSATGVAYMMAADGREFTSQAEIFARLDAPRIEGIRIRDGRSAAHFVVGLTEEISSGEAAHLAERYLDRIGLDPAKAIAFLHLDSEQPHMHIVANRVRDDGAVWRCFGVDRALALESDLINKQQNRDALPPMVARSRQSRAAEAKASRGELAAEWALVGGGSEWVACQGAEHAERRLGGAVEEAPICGAGLARMIGLRAPARLLAYVWR